MSSPAYLQNELKTNQTVGAFTVDSNLGHGTFGTVYKVCRTSKMTKRDRRFYAAKRIFQTPDKNETENNLKSAELEAIFQKITMEPSGENGGEKYFAKIYEVFIDMERKRQFHLLLELCEGPNLMEKYVEKNIIPTASNMLKLTKQLLKALSHLQKVKIIHADIKPENIMFVSKNADCHDIKIIDFGNSTPDDTTEFNRNPKVIERVDEELNSRESSPYDLRSVVCPKKSRIVCTAELD